MAGESRQEGEQREQVSPAGQAPTQKNLWLHWGAGFVFLVLFLFISGAFWLWNYTSLPIRPTSSQDIIVTIPSGIGLSGIQKTLEQNGVINSDIRFTVLAHLMGVSRQLKAGEYRFTAGQSPKEVLGLLQSGKVIQWPVTVPEGSNVFQLADILSLTLEINREQFLERATNTKLIASLGLDVPSLEGYLFPDTYLLPKGESPDSIIAMMVNRFLAVYQEAVAWRDTNKKVFQPSLNRHQIVTLASIVEKEAGMAEERPLIAGVFYNRLQKKMPLQADPTVIYGLKKFNEPLTKKDLKTQTGYNTYVKKGLPEGPISNPGRESLLAVLHPVQTPYLYFVSKNDGTHKFSKTLKEHNRAVQRYQR